MSQPFGASCNRPTRRVYRAIVAGLAVALMTGSGRTQSGEPTSSTGDLRFIENAGQWSSDARFIADVGALTICVLSDGVALRALDRDSGRAALIRISMEAALQVEPTGEGPRSGTYNFFLGQDSQRWKSGLRAFSRVRWTAIQPGVDMVMEAVAGRPTLSLLVAPGYAPDSVRFKVDGGTLISSPNGLLTIPTGLSPLALSANAHHVGPSGMSLTVTSRLHATDEQALWVSADDQDDAQPLVVNLGLEWATYLGGTNGEFNERLALSNSGDVIVAAGSTSLDFPVTPGVFDTEFSGANDVTISRLDPTGSELLSATYLGGSKTDTVFGVAVDLEDDITVFGRTSSADFPVTPSSYDPILGALADLYVARLSPNGQALMWSTYLGGDTTTSGEQAAGMALHSDKSVYVFGKTQDGTYPVTPRAFQTVPDNPGGQGGGDMVISHISADGTTLLHSTFLRGSSAESASAITLAADGVIVVGGSQSLDFPISPTAFDTVLPGGIVAKLDLTLSRLIFATVLSAHEAGVGGDLVDVAVDSSGCVTVVGNTMAEGWPVTPGVFDPVYSGQEDAYITRLDPDGTSLVYSTYLGSGSRDGAASVLIDSAGVATVAGFTDGSPFFPTTPGAWDTTANGGYDAFVVRVSPSGSAVWYGTYVGGSAADAPQGSSRLDIVERPDGRVVVAVRTLSLDFPVTEGAYDSEFNGMSPDSDLALAQLSMLPTGVGRYGNSTHGCAGYLAMGVTAMPQVGKPFSMTCRNALPSSTQGMLVLGLSDLASPLMAKGAEFWVSPIPVMLLLPMSSNSLGFATLGGTLPNSPALVGASFTVQSFWPDPCAPSGPISASNALAITIQP